MHGNRETSKTPAVQTDGRSAGEGLGRTARMYVSEESDRSIVPRNHSNKDGVSSAESEEGRLRIKENTFHSTRTRHRAGLRVSHGWPVCGQAVCLAVIHPR
jgi:hypothetical protein